MSGEKEGFSERIERLSEDLRSALNRKILAYYNWCLSIRNLSDEALFEAMSQLFLDRVKLYTRKPVGRIIKVLSSRLHLKAVFLGGDTLSKKTDRYLKRIEDA